MKLFAPLLAAFGFLTRIPVPGGTLLDRNLGRSLAFFPVVGVALGLGLSGLGALLGAALPPFLIAILLAVALAAVTGGLHLDGVADLFDALGGGRGDRARMLEIMKDSRIGAHGTVALVFLLLAKTAAIGQALAERDLPALLAFPTIARWAVTPLVALFPHARAEGLGRAFAAGARPVHLAMATAILAVTVAVLGPRFVIPSLVTLATAMTLGLWIRRKLGGLTGDVYGAAIEIGEVVALLVVGLHHR